MSNIYNKRVYFTYYKKKDFNKIEEYKHTGKDAETLNIILSDCSYFTEILETFPNIKELEFSIHNYTEDLKKKLKFPYLRKVHFSHTIPMDFKNFWSIFSNLEEITIGSRDNYELFTSQFVNRVIGRNEKSIKILRLLDIPIVKETYRPLRVPCQVDELEITFCTDYSIEKISMSQKYKKTNYDKQKYMKVPGLVFYTEEHEITKFELQNMKKIIQVQNNLKTLILSDFEIDSEFLEIIATKSTIKDLKLWCNEFRFNELSLLAKEFFANIQKLYLSHISEKSANELKLLIGAIKNVQILDIQCIWPEVDIEPLEMKNLLPNLKELNMHLNHKCEEVLNSLQFTEHLEQISGYFQNIQIVTELLKTSPNIKRFDVYYGSEEIANYIVDNFKKLEWFEVTLSKISLENVILIMKNSANIKRAKMYLYDGYSRDDLDFLDKKLEEGFPGFYFPYKDCVLEIHNDRIDFKMRVGYHHYMLGGNW